MTDLGVIEAGVLALLQDGNQIAIEASEVDEGLRRALAEYNQVQPYETESVVTLSAAGREIALSSITALAGITGVLDVWWPYTPTGETWPPNRVAGFRTWMDAGVLTLFLSSEDGPGENHLGQPQSGDQVRLWWTKDNTINTFDGATATTLTSEGKALVILGAAGLAAVSAALDRSEVLDRETLRKWGEAKLADFRARLEKLRAKSVRSSGEPFGKGWQMDKWDV